MRKLSLVALAASAALLPLIPGSAALAQPAGHGPGAAAHKWPDRGDVTVMRHAPAAAREMRREMRRMHPGGPHHRGRFSHIQKIGRGGFVPGFWWGPQLVVRNWHGYGFPQPFAGGRWIRYYDDALLIDRHGRVHDSRHGWDWDRDRDRWGERDGIPVYVGDGDYEPEDEDYEWAERWDRGEGPDRYGHDMPPPGPDCGNPCTRTYHGPPPPHHGYYGYGCGCGPVVVTETITTTAPVVEKVTYYDYVTEEVRAAPRQKRVIRKRAPAPRPRPGERG